MYMSVYLDGVARLQQAVGESLSPKQWNQAGQKVTHKHEYWREVNARLERLSLKVQQQFREMMDEGELPTGADLRMILRPLRAQKMLNIGAASTVRQVYEVWKSNYLKKKNRGQCWANLRT